MLGSPMAEKRKRRCRGVKEERRDDKRKVKVQHEGEEYVKAIALIRMKIQHTVVL